MQLFFDRNGFNYIQSEKLNITLKIYLCRSLFYQISLLLLLKKMSIESIGFVRDRYNMYEGCKGKTADVTFLEV